MDTLGRDTQAQPGTMQQLLRVPLSAKLAGANLIIVLVAWGVGFAAHRSGAADWRLLSVMTVALVLGFIVNFTLVSLALRPIRDLEETATRVWSGDLETRVPQSPIADSDLAQVGSTLNYLLTALAEDRARVRLLASEVVRTSDRERSRVGKELHDSVAQSIAALRYQLIAIEQSATDPVMASKIEAVRSSAGDLLEQVRVLSHEVHPQILDDLGLVPALRHLARKTDQVAIEIVIAHASETELSTLPVDVSAALYRVAREAVTNAVRHGGATTVTVGVGVANGEVAMEVDDDGRGFDVASAERNGGAMGLFTMRERIALLHGTVDITSARARGTSVRVRVPLAPTTSAPSNSDGASSQRKSDHAR
jgi:signal transduction histidine kinase